ncbi:MAG TPA: FHA domain-containing protein [Leptospiraceae bacterium]|nr:FHA domain-containing protein [Leptospiraceae bacterium]
MKLLSVLFLSLFFGSLHSAPKIEKIDISAYPMIRVFIFEDSRRRLEEEKIIIQERIDEEVYSISSAEILRYRNPRPVNVLFSIMSSTWEKNKSSKEAAMMISSLLKDEDRIYLHFFSGETEGFLENLNKANISGRLDSIPQGGEGSVLHFLDGRTDRFSALPSPNVFFLFVPEKPKDTFSRNSKFLKYAEKVKLPFRIIGIEDTMYSAMAESARGKFFAYKDQNWLSDAEKIIAANRRPAAVIEYRTAFDENWLYLILGREITVHLNISEFQSEVKYTASIPSLLGAFMENTFFVIISGILLVAFCLVFLILLERRITSYKRKDFLKKMEEKKKADLYYQENRTYASTASGLLNSKSASHQEEELELDIDPDVTTEEYMPALSGIRINKDENAVSYSKAFLILKEGPNPGRQYMINQAEITIGSLPTNDLVLLDRTVDSRHARIRKIDGVYYLFDLVSKNGISLNGKKLLKPRSLKDSDEIRLGKSLLIFRGKDEI